MLDVKNLAIDYPRFSLKNISFRVDKGEYFILFGPTGSGKTLIFELISGIRKPAGGTVSIGEKDVTRIDPAYRNIGYVPQDFALFPFKNVYQNIAFGLESRPVPADEKKQRIDEMLRLLKIEHLKERMPKHLSGGEKQRVALGRALAIQPDILLLDEPLSAVDENTGDILMREIKNLHRELNITILHICHRLDEVFYLADRMGILREGAIVQMGTPQKIYQEPLNVFVANLLKVKNIVPGEVKKKGEQHWFYLAGQPVLQSILPPGPAAAVIFPEKIRLVEEGATIDREKYLVFSCSVRENESWKPVPEIVLDAGFHLTIRQGVSSLPCNPSGKVQAVISKEDILLLPE